MHVSNASQCSSLYILTSRERLPLNPQCLVTAQCPIVVSHHQLAFLTPGIFPSSAFIRKGYCIHQLATHWRNAAALIGAYPCHAKVAEHATTLPSFCTPVPYLRWSGIAVHLR